MGMLAPKFDSLSLKDDPFMNVPSPKIEAIVVVLAGASVGGEPSFVNFRNPKAPPNESLSTKTITSPFMGSTAKYSPALLLSWSP